MKHTIILTASILAALSVRIVFFAQGYFVDPALLGFFFDPLILPALALAPAVVAIAYVIRLIRREKSAQNIRLTVVALCGPVVLLMAPILPGGMDAFFFRMKQFPQAAYHSLAGDLRREFETRGIQIGTVLSSDDKEWDAVYQALRPAHPILQVNRRRPYVMLHDSHVIVFWGSGLTGAYEVIILTGPDKPPWLDSQQRPIIYIHDDVGLGFRP